MANINADVLRVEVALESSAAATLRGKQLGMALDSRRLVYEENGGTLRYYWDSTRLADQTSSYGTALIGTPGITGITPSGGSSGAAATLQAMLTGLAGTGNANFIHNGTTQQSSSNFNISGAGVIGTTLTVSGLSANRVALTGTAGLLVQDSFYVDRTNKRMGIGDNASTPGVPLHVCGESAASVEVIRLQSGQSVGAASDYMFIGAMHRNGAGANIIGGSIRFTCVDPTTGTRTSKAGIYGSNNEVATLGLEVAANGAVTIPVSATVSNLAGTGNRIVTSNAAAGLLGNATTIAGNYTLSGSLAVGLTLDVTGIGTFSNSLNVGGNLSVTGESTLQDKTVMSRTLNTSDTGSYVAVVGGQITKNNANTRQFYGLRVWPTLNSGGSNTNTTLTVLDVDTDNVATTGITTTIAKFSYGGTERFRIASDGGLWTNLGSDQVLYVGSGGDSGKIKVASVYVGTGSIGINTSPSGSAEALKVGANASNMACIAIDPTTGSPANPSASYSRLYLKGNLMIFQFNDAGTTRYKYLDLSGTGVTWTHTTSAP